MPYGVYLEKIKDTEMAAATLYMLQNQLELMQSQLAHVKIVITINCRRDQCEN